jgi:hypothetical protein
MKDTINNILRVITVASILTTLYLLIKENRELKQELQNLKSKYEEAQQVN